MLVVGATRILRLALDELRKDHIVFALARGAATLADIDGVHPLVADLTDFRSVHEALRNAPSFDCALVYAPTASHDVLALLADHVAGRFVDILTSRHASPDPDDDDDEVDPSGLPSVGIPLLLGWTVDGGTARWHTPAEISQAALDVLGTGRAATLGTVRPWTSRPSLG